MLDFIPQFTPLISERHIKAVSDQMLSGCVGSRTTTIMFENKIKEITGAKHCVSTTSGTTAIMMAITAMKLPVGSTILFPCYTFLAGANACRLLGYKVQLVDIKMDTLCMDPEQAELALARDDKMKISCVIFVNHNAYVGEDTQKIKQLCDRYKVPMLEDSSQAIGMNNAGRTGAAGIFSFSVPKLITTGQGGAVITDDAEIACECMKWRDHGDTEWRQTKVHNNIGGNFKFNDILASYGLSQLNEIDELLHKRKLIFDRYRMNINLLDYKYDSTWMVVYKCTNFFANTLVHALKNENIQGVRYYRPICSNPPYHSATPYSKAHLAYRDIIYLPSSLNLKQDEIDRVCSVVVETERRERNR